MRSNHLHGPRALTLTLLSFLLLTILFSATVGSASLSIPESLMILLGKLPFAGSLASQSQIKPVYQTIVWEIRMPRILLAGLTGCGLSVVGAAFQGLFKNPLADPHILGVSSGSALGATLAMLTGLQIHFLGTGAIGLSAFLGALCTVFVVYRIACIGTHIPVVTILLTGTAISTMLSSIISLLMVFHHDQIEKVYLWTLGSFSAASWTKVEFLALFLLIGVSGILLHARELDAMTMGYETAESLGIDTTKVKKILIVLSSLVVAACVSVSGIIGFVGLVIPHCIRMLCGPGHRRLLPLSCLLGAIFLILCDTLARTVAAPSEIPVGVITAVFGTPYFIFLLQQQKRKAVRA